MGITESDSLVLISYQRRPFAFGDDWEQRYEVFEDRTKVDGTLMMLAGDEHIQNIRVLEVEITHCTVPEFKVHW